MKRILSLLLILSMVMFVFSGCASENGNDISDGTSLHSQSMADTTSNQDTEQSTSNTECCGQAFL